MLLFILFGAGMLAGGGLVLGFLAWLAFLVFLDILALLALLDLLDNLSNLVLGNPRRS